MKASKSTFTSILRVTLVAATLAGMVWLIGREQLLKRPDKLFVTQSGSIDMCLSCHTEEKLDPAHDASVIGCTPCHLGNPLAITKDKGHKGMVRNPGDLRHVAKTCSVEGCHPTDEHKVKNSLMATNRGILGTLLYYWGEADNQNSNLSVEELIRTGQTSLALDYFRKLCATCHLWKQKNDLDGIPKFFNEKGGGCSACHFHIPDKTSIEMVLVSDDDTDEGEEEKKIHPHITRAVSSVNCIRCHNRSGRIGISYMGIFEAEGYGTPYEQGALNSNQLPGARFYLEIADDVHHAKGMECIDCHTRNEIMGDGTNYAHYEEQLEISCETCHSRKPGRTRKNNMLTNLESEGGEILLFGKVDDKPHPVRQPKAGVCDFPAHKRVSCEGCHSTWVAQCYGCHAKRDGGERHLDKLSLQETKGLWEEGRSYIRYERPMLGVWQDDIVVVTPGCQDIVTVVGEDGNIEQSFDRFTMAAINPHTTQAKGRECFDCHGSTKSVGLGEGRIFFRDGEMFFESLDKGVESSVGKTVPFDAYVNIAGKALQHGSRPDLRPFNSSELRKILRVGLCVRCHDRYGDKIWQHYDEKMLCPESDVDEVYRNGSASSEL